MQRGNVKITNLTLLNAVLYVAEQSCKWRGLPKRFGNWHSIYTRLNRWSKSGVLQRVFARLQAQQIILIKIEAVSLDSTIVKVHPDGTGALKKRPASHREKSGRLDHQNSSGGRKCLLRADVCPVSRTGRRWSTGAGTPAQLGAPTGVLLVTHGPCLRR